MGNASLAGLLSQTQSLNDALRNHMSSLPSGVDEQFIDNMEKLRKDVENLNVELNKLRADLKIKKEELSKNIETLKDLYAQSKKSIKFTFPQNRWREFGIEDKR